jgi:hypothetical protein
MLSLDHFKPVSLEDQNFFRQLYDMYPQVHSDNTFTNMMCWNSYANYSYAKVNGNVVLASTIDGITKFRPPIGPYNPTLTRDLLRLATETGDAEPIILIDPAAASLMSYAVPRLEMVPDRDQSEYVYSAADLAGLQGRDYLYIRREINKFKRTYKYDLEPVSQTNLSPVKEFVEKWYDTKNPEEGTLAGYEKEALIYGLDHMSETGLAGLTIRVDGQIGALSMFERMSQDTALVHFEKGLQDYPGIYKVINQETALRLSGQFTYINRESDMGVPGLREAKLRYHPHHMVEVYSAVMPKNQCALHHLAKWKCCGHCCT